jgi:hypothetical protein
MGKRECLLLRRDRGSDDHPPPLPSPIHQVRPWRRCSECGEQLPGALSPCGRRSNSFAARSVRAGVAQPWQAIGSPPQPSPNASSSAGRVGSRLGAAKSTQHSRRPSRRLATIWPLSSRYLLCLVRIKGALQNLYQEQSVPLGDVAQPFVEGWAYPRCKLDSATGAPGAAAIALPPWPRQRGGRGGRRYRH